MQYLSLKIPGADGNPMQIEVPGGVPTGGLEPGGTAHKIIQVGIQYLFIFAIIASLFMLLWAGFQWLTSEGDKTAVQAARQKIIYAIMGLIIVFLAFFIVKFTGSFFKVTFFP